MDPSLGFSLDPSAVVSGYILLTELQNDAVSLRCIRRHMVSVCIIFGDVKFDYLVQIMLPVNVLFFSL